MYSLSPKNLPSPYKNGVPFSTAGFMDSLIKSSTWILALLTNIRTNIIPLIKVTIIASSPFPSSSGL